MDCFQARSLPGNEHGEEQLWCPPNRTMTEWLNCRGLPEEVCERVNSKYSRLVDLLAREKGIENVQDPTAAAVSREFYFRVATGISESGNEESMNLYIDPAGLSFSYVAIVEKTGRH